MSPAIVSLIIIIYFLVLVFIGWLTSRKADEQTFFTANRNSPWFLVAFGMIGASLSGVTFISVPGEVGGSNFSYFQVVMEYTVGYLVIGTVLLPLYYRLNLVSIYGYLQERLGPSAYKMGAVFFLLSRTIGAAFRLFLVAGVLQIAIFSAIGVPFWVSVAITIVLIWIYTFKGGIKTIVWTDSLQTFFMLVAAALTVLVIFDRMDLSFTQGVQRIIDSPQSKIFVWDWQSGKNFFKSFFSGAFIAIVMTGLDQDMMQKNLTIKTVKAAQKNILWFTVALVLVNLIFLSLGNILYQYAQYINIDTPERTDFLYPTIALNHLPVSAAVLFVLGIVAAAYSSADSALTALTTSFCYDILDFSRRTTRQKERIKRIVHISFSLLLFLVILVFNAFNDQSVINSIFIAAGYTYGPLLGLFSFGILTRWQVRDRWIPVVCLLSPVLSYIININSEAWFGGYKFGFEILILNGAITFLGLVLLKRTPK